MSSTESRMLYKEREALSVQDPDKPIRPGNYDCCEGGCSPCIWDTYYEDMEVWKAAQAKKKSESVDIESKENEPSQE